MSTYNDLGIGSELDWKRIRKLFKIGIFAACMVLAGDMLLGWGMHDPAVSGLEGFLSAYLNLSDRRIFWSAFLGLIGIPLEVLCCFSVYRLIAPCSEKYAHLYRTGIIGSLAFAGCGVHVPCLACVFFYKYMNAADPETALDLSIRFGMYFLLPAMILFTIFWLIQQIAQVLAFAKGLTPLPSWSWIFAPAIGMGLTMLLKFFPETPLRNAVTAGWISIGHIWMFGGLMILCRRK